MKTERHFRGAGRALAAGGAALLWIAAEGLAQPQPPAKLEPAPQYADIARRVARRLPREHLLHLQLDDTISARSWTNYLSALDYERVYFLQSDLEAFRSDAAQLDDDLKAGKVDFAYRVYDVFRERVSNRVDFVEKLLSQGFDFTAKESILWDRKEAPWPANEAEWNELWRKRVKNEYLRSVISREAATNAPAASVTNAPAETSTNAAAVPVPSHEESIRKRYHQFQTVLNDSDSDAVMQRFVSSVTMAYDPHSQYMSPSSSEDFDIEMRLSLVGIGALLEPEDGAAKIVRLIPGGPADRDKREQRLRPGDKIIAVGQDAGTLVDTLHWPLQKVVKLIRGAKGSRVFLSVIPASDPTGSTTRTVDLVRDEVKLEEQAAKSKIHAVPGGEGAARNFAVIDLPAFYANLKASEKDANYRSASDDIAKILRELPPDTAGVLLDLRGNGGGSLLEAIKMTGLFIRTGPTVQVKERFGVRPLWDEDPRVAYAGPLVVLVNRLSASASEILAGALQDYGRAIVVGDSKTHGKGTVQSVQDVGSDESLGSLKLTTANYYRITGSSTQLKGVTPDIVIRSSLDYLELGEEYLPNPIPWDSVESTPYAAVDDLSAVVPILRQKSMRRRVEDPRFAAHEKMLKRVDEVNRAKEMPLNIEERRLLAKTEKDILALQQETGETEKPEEQNGSKDLILGEALRILSDFAALEGKRTDADLSQGGGSASNSIGDWLRRNL